MKITCKFFVNIRYQLLIRVWTCFYFLKTCVQTQRSPQTRLPRGELRRRRWWPHWRRSTFTSGSGIWIITWIYSICSALWKPPSKTGPDRFVLVLLNHLHSDSDIYLSISEQLIEWHQIYWLTYSNSWNYNIIFVQLGFCLKYFW